MGQEGCPVSFAVRACPFLHDLAEKQGEEYARSIAINPFVPACSGGRRPLLEEAVDLSRTFRLFHGPVGLVPLRKFTDDAATSTSHSAPLASPSRSGPAPSLAALPFASMSLSGGMPDFGGFFRKFGSHNNKPKPKPRRVDPPRPQPQQPNSSATTGSHSISPSSPPTPNLSSGSSGAGIGPISSSGNGAASSSSAGLCPMRKLLGPLAPVIFNSKGHLQCPEPIVKARAALAATKPIRELRPQALPIKFLAIGAATAALNMPCGAWREHCKKFSVGWFIAVHATIPFIAMLRKAVIMPKYAILFTIAAAVAGQAIGARLERKRMQVELQQQVAVPRLVGSARKIPLITSEHHTAVPLASISVAGAARPARQRTARPMVAPGSCGSKFVLEELKEQPLMLLPLSAAALSAH